MRLVAELVRSGNGGKSTAIPAIAAPGISVPRDAFYVVMLGRAIKHRESGQPVQFYQRYINRGEVFNLTRNMYGRMQGGE